MRIIVQKFGGTSVATAEGRRHAADRITEAVEAGCAPVVVVSAMGRAGDPYATDTLIQLATALSPDLAPRELDQVMSCGEIISSVVMTATLQARGLKATALTGGQAGIRTDDSFGSAHILEVRPDPVLALLRQGLVPVVAGFQGMTNQGQIATLGRGGSDTTASALGGALQAEVVEIYTDVDGVKTADPRLVPEARTLTVTTYDEIAQMAHYGAKVVHPRAVEIAMQHRVPLRIRSTFDPTPGTLITYSLESAGAWDQAGVSRSVTGVTHVTGLCQVTLDGADDQFVQVFRVLADAGISIDLINLSPGLCRFCVEERKAERAQAMLAELGFAPALRCDLAKVSVVGSGMRGRPGVMAVVAEALARAGVPILQTVDSHVTISCLVAARDLKVAAQALHAAFSLW
jgi:aspartate kinase